MKTVHSITKWTNQNRTVKRHIANIQGHPLCGGDGKRTQSRSWIIEEDIPDCKRCIRAWRKLPTIFDLKGIAPNATFVANLRDNSEAK